MYIPKAYNNYLLSQEWILRTCIQKRFNKKIVQKHPKCEAKSNPQANYILE